MATRILFVDDEAGIRLTLGAYSGKAWFFRDDRRLGVRGAGNDQP